MGAFMHIQPESIWDFFQENKPRLSKEMVVIAENNETGYAVYLTEENGIPRFCVCRGDGSAEYEEDAANARECVRAAKRCCSQYLVPVTAASRHSGFCSFDKQGNVTEPDGQDPEDAAYEREDALMLALRDFLNVVLQRDADITDVLDFYDQESLEVILDSVLAHLATEFGMDIYRPMMVEAESGGEIYAEYPYDGLAYKEA